MDFFDRQETARKKTKLLVFYFTLAVIGIALSVYVVVTMGKMWMGGDMANLADPGGAAWLDWPLLAGSGLGTLTLILVGTGFKSMQLSAGGAFVAKELGGRRIDHQTTNPAERRLLNVVEEMAIASGVPVPEVFVMEDERTVNAFAAGKTTSDAVIGVTRGCMNMLSRDELQAVIAHEFSHILNGDMRLNMRLIALVFGITALTIVGRIVLRSTSRSRERNAFPFVLFGLALVVIGYVGVLCGRLIQRAVSRQREFLADASAVQFTRNPDGMSGALKKIGALGSQVNDPHVEEASHMMIASALSNDRGSLFATHPPLGDRIRAIDPNWDGTFDDVKFPAIGAGAGEVEGAGRVRPGGGGKPLGGDDFLRNAAILSTGVLQSLGELHADHLKQGRAIIGEFPQRWLDLTTDPAGAQLMVFALLTGQGRGASGLRDALSGDLDESAHAETMRLSGELENLHSSRKLALVDLAIATLRRLSQDEYARFLKVTHRIVTADGRVDLFEFTLQKVIERHLDIHFHQTRPAKVRYRHLGQLREETAVLLSALATLSGEGESEHRAAFAAGTDDLRGDLGGEALRYRGQIDLDRIDEALTRFDAATPRLKKLLLHAGAQVVIHDQRTSSQEAELLRAMADTIGVGIPPFVSEASTPA